MKEPSLQFKWVFKKPVILSVIMILPLYSANGIQKPQWALPAKLSDARKSVYFDIRILLLFKCPTHLDVFTMIGSGS